MSATYSVVTLPRVLILGPTVFTTTDFLPPCAHCYCGPMTTLGVAVCCRCGAANL